MVSVVQSTKSTLLYWRHFKLAYHLTRLSTVPMTKTSQSDVFSPCKENFSKDGLTLTRTFSYLNSNAVDKTAQQLLFYMYKVKYILERFGCSKHQCLFTKERKKKTKKWNKLLKGEDCTKKPLGSKNLYP